ncbi:MAG: lamin tail domain-containing protein [Verrucomicrobiales bacterium]|nr:lamin tail domain-containing protein [Verrucomicrobiales bacterium]
MHLRVVVAIGVSLVIGLGAFRSRAAGGVEISEFLAANTKVFADEDGAFEDWIELRNTSGQPVSLQDWSLTDDPALPKKWVFPSVSLPAGGYLVVFASGKDRRPANGGRSHTNFRLDNAGEYLGLFAPDGETPASEFAPEYPPQAADISYGVSAQGTRMFFSSPTPGSANGDGFVDQVADTKFSVNRGYFTAPFDLVIQCETPGAEIRATTNGTPPTATTGFVVNKVLRISGTTVVRAAAFKAGWMPSNVDTHTYLFTSDVIRQSATGAPPPGWPTSWGANARDYGMDQRIVNDARYSGTLENDLRTIPTFCVSMHLPDLFDPSRGIYANPGQDGRAWERPMSLELIYPDGREGFHINGGIRIRGGFSRSTGNPKHAFRFFFRQEYGEGKLRFPLFGEGATDEFDGFDLRTFQNYSWSFQGDPNGTFLRDQFNRDLQLAMGQQAERGDYYHLYIDGQYWGLYNTCERPEASYAAGYFGGLPEDYDVIKVEAGPYAVVATDGNLSGWTELYNLVKPGVDDVKYRRLLGQNPDGTRNPEYPVYVDPVNLIDYMLVILYGGNLDAPISNFLGNTSPNNYFGVWNRVAADQGFRFFVHDAEHTLLDVNADRTGPYPAGDGSVAKSSPQWLWQKLLQSPEFRILVSDRIQRHLFNSGGVLTAEKARSIYERRRAEIDRAVVAESARWGDAQRASDPLNRNDDWLPAVARNLDFIARRPAVLINQLRADGLYPGVAAPQFNQQGGPVNSGFALLMAPGTSTIYYTLDGSDPRSPGGAIASSARRYSGPVRMTESAVVRARVLTDNVWSALNEAEFIIIQTFKELRITEIHYHPQGTADRDGDDFEFLELKNVGSRELDLSGVSLTDGVSYRFPNGTRLAAGGFLVLARNAEAFSSRYVGQRAAGVYTGRLSNSGDRLALVHATGAEIFSASYDTRPPWPPLADGDGFSLVPALASGDLDFNQPGSWRSSTRIGGSPGADDPIGGIAAVVVNEVLTHTDPPLLDSVEIHNPGDTAAMIGGWWLSDDRAQPKKFRIPAGTTVPPLGFITFDETQFNRPTNAPGSFSLSSYGDEIWVFSADAAGELTGYSDGFSFGASANGVSLGRYTNSVGDLGYPAQDRVTLGQPNAQPRLGPVVINEIQYQPVAGGVEFIELLNLSASSVPLYDPEAPTNTWRLSGVGFSFPTQVILPPGGLAVVTGGDPDSVRLRYGIPASVPVFGPYSGVLQDGGETVSLERPDKPDILPDGTILVPYYEVESVSYRNAAPWPPGAAGLGSSLERRARDVYADDPSSWRASFGEPSPGFPNDGNRTPLVDAGPDREIESATYPLQVTLSGVGSDDGLPVVPGRLGFQWSQVDGPGVVTFTGAGTSNATVRLPGIGDYTLRLTVSDGERTRSDDVILRARRPSDTQVWIAAGDTWRYLDDGSDQGTAWRTAGFSDAGWPAGPAKMGFGDADMRTTLRRTIDGTPSTTFYFRKTFTVADPSGVVGLKVRLMRDDGAMVYLNNQLVFRSNMPEGNVTASTLASEVVGGADETAYFDQIVDPTSLVSGENLIAVEVHQQNSGSTDVSFDLILEAQANPANRGPVALAGSDITGSVGQSLELTGQFQDDGLPSPPGVVRFSWRQVEGPGTATFTATNTPNTTVQFPAAGRYVLRFAVDDGALSAFDEVVATIGGDEYATWRGQYFTSVELGDPTVSGDDADPDRDGQSNRSEFLSGTHPRESGSVLRLRAVRTDQGTRLLVSVVKERSYTVLARSEVNAGTWQVVQHLNSAACDCEVEVLDASTAGETRFYRVITPKLP